MRAISKWEEVPIFDSEEAEAEFSESVAISLRIDPRMLARIKRLARSRYLNYQSMIKQWLSERLEREAHER
jgi:predicted DNA binding CopG/RHH family protein